MISEFLTTDNMVKFTLAPYGEAGSVTWNIAMSVVLIIAIILLISVIKDARMRLKKKKEKLGVM